MRAALRNWARCHEEVQVVAHNHGDEHWIELVIDGQEIATVLVRAAV